MSSPPHHAAKAAHKLRWVWHIRGQVQGVGFRPFVWRVAREAGVTGLVFNNASGVHVEIRGGVAELAAFALGFEREMPALARVVSCRRREVPVVAGEEEFVIQGSHGTGHGGVPGDSEVVLEAAVTVDTAVCDACLREMLAAGDRRHGHALINCTNCGPRFSIIREVPYDRVHTTMAGFAMCAACRAEYENPGDRRFHAQPICCPRCGPKVELAHGRERVAGGGKGAADAIGKAAQLLRAGRIVAIKGLGGFHLAVRADDQEAVTRLRVAKRRDAKPMAVMCRDLAMVRSLVRLSAAGEAELVSAHAPIVLAPRLQVDRRGHGAPMIAPEVAPGTDLLGVMLPYTPLHHLLWRALDDACAAAGETPGGQALVMTSGNLSNEPLVIDNADAAARLGPMCDAILWHNRPIERCVDDSVVLDRGGVDEAREVLPIRRSRGYAPAAWLMEDSGPTGLCVGGELKSTVAVVREREIIVSQHLGELTDARSYGHFQKAIEDLVRLFRVPVQFVAHDLHPSYMSTQAARELAGRFGAQLIGVQHHVAHAWAVMGEHHLKRALAIVCDGTGYGPDKTIWGGELLSVDGEQWRRLGRLRPMRLPGGDAAARDPRRSAMALLHQAYGEGFEELPEAVGLFPDVTDRRMLARMIGGGVSSPWTSSTGRLFDGVAALLEICVDNGHEAQAAMALEAAAWSAAGTGKGEIPSEEMFEVRQSGKGDAEEIWELDMSPLVRWMVGQRRQFSEASAGRAGREAGCARIFHRVLAQGWMGLLTAAVGGEAHGKVPVVASGGSLCNRLLEKDLRELGSAEHYRTFFHKSYPPTDAGLAFGQAYFSRQGH